MIGFLKISKIFTKYIICINYFIIFVSIYRLLSNKTINKKMNCVKNNIDFSKDIIIKSQEILASLAQLLPDDKNKLKLFNIGLIQLIVKL